MLLFALALLAASCGGGANQSGGTPSCSSPPPGIGPDAAGTLQLEDKGKIVCFKVGDELTAFLSVPLGQESSRWGPIQASDTSILEAMNAGILTLPRGVTGAVYRVLRAGSVQLTSVRPPCTGPDASCSPDQTWRATIIATQ